MAIFPRPFSSPFNSIVNIVITTIETACKENTALRNDGLIERFDQLLSDYFPKADGGKEWGNYNRSSHNCL
jgi:hypothetical protein